jgi:hypothetical protein
MLRLPEPVGCVGQVEQHGVPADQDRAQLLQLGREGLEPAVDAIRQPVQELELADAVPALLDSHRRRHPASGTQGGEPGAPRKQRRLEVVPQLEHQIAQARQVAEIGSRGEAGYEGERLGQHRSQRPRAQA